MTTAPRLIHCMMYVEDLERAIAFYDRVLCFAVVDRHRYEGHDLAYLKSPASQFEIELVQPHALLPKREKQDTAWHLGFSVDNLDAEYARLHAMGVRLDPIEPYIANGTLQTRYFYLYDPDGHQVEFLEARGRYGSPMTGAKSPS